jgi:fatty acid desaturase|nr:hypothetical protein [uncultured Methanoregula sp.]
MTHIIADTIRTYLGWCPNARSPGVAIPRAGVLSHTADLPDTPQPGATPLVTAVPRWMTAVSIAILFATLFVGGNFWWPIFVLGVLVIFVFIHIRTIQTHGRA